MCLEQAIDISKALLTPVIAIVAGYIAWQQLKTNRRKLKLDLFEKRYAVFEKIGEFIGSILTSGKVGSGKDMQFLVDTKAVGLLFSEDISTFVSEIYRKAVRLHTLDAELEGTQGPQRISNIEAQREIKDWYGEALEGLEARFREYLKLEHWIAT
jgi:hypothetical protein